jgi:hypothetical protein
MDIVALIAWIITALGGSYLLATWLIRGGMRQRKTGATSFPASLILGHFLLAASGLAAWTVYVFTEMRILAWAASADLLLVATLGFTMFFRWGGEPVQAGTAPLPNAARTAGTARKAGTAVTTARRQAERPAESHFPIAVVAGHGALAVSTFIVVLLATLGVGS